MTSCVNQSQAQSAIVMEATILYNGHVCLPGKHRYEKDLGLIKR